MKKNIVIAILMLFTAVINLVGCSSSSDNSLNAESGTVTGSLLDAANSNIVATSDSGEYLIPVGADGRFSATLPVVNVIVVDSAVFLFPVKLFVYSTL